MVYANGSLWIANEFAGSVTQFSTEGAALGDYEIGSAPRAMLWDGERLWVASEQDNVITRVDVESGEVRDRFPIDGGPTGLAFDGRALWVALSGTGEVVQLDRASGSVLQRVSLDARPVALLLEGDTLWVADQSGDQVIGIDILGGSQQSSIDVEGGPFAIAQVSCGAGCVDLWVAGEASDTVSRIRLP
jgi:sugar lactone lactonase YvrE